MDRLSHPFPPLYDADSRILILGSFPSVKSREAMFFYGHPQNRFWRVVSTVLGCECPRTVEEKQQMLHTHHIALWDTIASCEISGSSDSSIKNAVPCDLGRILSQAPIKQIFANGGKAYELYQKYSYPVLKREITKLPSTSPANAAFQMDRLLKEWKIIKKALQ